MLFTENRFSSSCFIFIGIPDVIKECTDTETKAKKKIKKNWRLFRSQTLEWTLDPCLDHSFAIKFKIKRQSGSFYNPPIWTVVLWHDACVILADRPLKIFEFLAQLWCELSKEESSVWDIFWKWTINLGAEIIATQIQTSHHLSVN